MSLKIAATGFLSMALMFTATAQQDRKSLPADVAYSVTLESDDYMVSSAGTVYQAKNDFLPNCATGYLGGNHTPAKKVRYFDLRQDGDVSVITGTVKKKLFGICGYTFHDSRVQIVAKDRPICRRFDYSDGCVHPANVSLPVTSARSGDLVISCGESSSYNQVTGETYWRLDCGIVAEDPVN